MNAHWHLPGKLLLTAEYAIRNGAIGLAIPLSKGQSLQVKSDSASQLRWTSKNAQGETWFHAGFDINNFSIIETSDHEKCAFIQQLLIAAKELNPDFLSNENGLSAAATLDFDPDWGLGSSSTLTALIARWSETDAFELFFKTQNGSAYDVAVALSGTPALYTLRSGKPEWSSVDWKPPAAEDILFVYTGKKAGSAESLRRYNPEKLFSADDISTLTLLTHRWLSCPDTETLMQLMQQHESLLSARLHLPKANSQFPWFSGAVKWLGAWGGDFVMAVKPGIQKNDFTEKGFDTVFSYRELVLNP